MRLSKHERDTIVSQAKRHFGPQARVMLFGSRTDDSRRGGDIDLLVQGVPDLGDAFQRKIRFLVDVKSELGDQRIDVVLSSVGDHRPIVREASVTGVEL